MRIIITGGSGLIGRALAADLAVGGHEVVVLSRDPGQVTSLPTGVRAVGWDGRSAAGWGQLADGAGAIVNLAGASVAGGRWTDDRKRVIRDSRVNAGRAVVEAVTQAAYKPGVVIQPSGVGYYGPRGDEEVTEDDARGTDFLAGVSRDWEAATAAVEALGVRRCVLRIGVVLSGAGGALPRMAQPFRLYGGGPIGSGRQWMPWIHIADVVGAMRFLIDTTDARGVFNLCAPNALPNRDFAKALGRAMGRPAVVPAPAFAMKLAFGELSTILLDGQRAVPRRLLAAGYAFRFPTAEAALRDIYG